MARKTLLRQICFPFLIVTVISLAALGGFTLNSIQNFFFEQTRKALEGHAWLVAQQVKPHLSQAQQPALQNRVRTLGQAAGTRITLVLPDGRVLADSEKDPLRMDNHANRLEIREALKSGMGMAMRENRTGGTHLMYVAVPVYRDSRLAGVVRTASSLETLEDTLRGMTLKFVLGGLGVVLIVSLIGLTVSRRISEPLALVATGARRFADGDLDSRIHVSGSQDIQNLAQALNQMAAELDERIRTLTNQRNEHEAILSSMSEGVFAVDSQERIISLNQAAARLLAIQKESAPGHSIQEVVRNSQLQEFVKVALTSDQTVEDILVFQHGVEDRYVQAVGTVLHDSNNLGIGAVIVLNDITRLRRLENVRRDFVANVSHELKTPITSIKGFVETLLDGAMKDPEEAERFLKIVAKQSDRLNAIIEDLLSLSRIEQDAEQHSIVVEPHALRPVLESAVQSCFSKAAAKNIPLEIECDAGLVATVNPALIEQAIVNLVDNAIKYSDPESPVRVSAKAEGDQLVLQVTDTGRGIPREHHPRLFERFYRVDKARSRQMGGTGLGLAIVKHIAQAHGGSVHLESDIGRGSTFTLRLPLVSPFGP